MPYLNVTKGWPNMHAVDLAIPDGSGGTIVEGMGISVSANTWIRGIPKGAIGYITGPEQSPTALDVARVQATTFDNESPYPAGNGEMGRGNMGGICLSNPLEFQTDQYDSGVVAGMVVYCPTGTGKFTQATDAANHQIAGSCRYIASNLNAGNNPGATNFQGGLTIAEIIALPALLLP